MQWTDLVSPTWHSYKWSGKTPELCVLGDVSVIRVLDALTSHCLTPTTTTTIHPSTGSHVEHSPNHYTDHKFVMAELWACPKCLFGGTLLWTLDPLIISSELNPLSHRRPLFAPLSDPKCYIIRNGSSWAQSVIMADPRLCLTSKHENSVTVSNEPRPACAPFSPNRVQSSPIVM